MSKPETPQIIDIMGALKASLAAHPNAKPNAPKAEAPPKPVHICGPKCLDYVCPAAWSKPAPPANVSEGTLIPTDVLMPLAEVQRLRTLADRNVGLCKENLALKAQSEAQAQVGIDLVRENDALKAQNAALETENIRLEGVIFDSWDTGTVPHKEGQAILARNRRPV